MSKKIKKQKLLKRHRIKTKNNLRKKKHREKYLYYKKREELEKYHLNKLEKKLKVQLPKPIILKPIIKPKKLWQKIKTIFQKK